MYELFILSKLLHRPMHGYLIHTILNFAIGPSHRLSWGTLYPLIKKLERNGCIVALDRGKDDPRGKVRYRATEVGRIRLLELLNGSGENNAHSRDLFRIKLGCFGHLGTASRIAILKDYRSHLDHVLEHSNSMIDRVEQESNLPPEEKTFALLGLEHQKTVTQFEAKWIDSLLQNPALSFPAVKVSKGRRKRIG